MTRTTRCTSRFFQKAEGQNTLLILPDEVAHGTVTDRAQIQRDTAYPYPDLLWNPQVS